MIVLIGKKIGMTRIFSQEGYFIPVTVIKIEDNIITCIKKISSDGYYSTQVTFGNTFNKVNKCSLGFFSKINISPRKKLWEIPYLQDIHLNIGQNINISLFSNVKKVNVTSYSKGKGFTGTIKRWNFKSQDKSHGNSLSHRVPGSIGQNQTPGKVFKGKKMAGRMGNKKITIKKMKVIDINENKKYMLVKGCIAGYIGCYVYVKSYKEN